MPIAPSELILNPDGSIYHLNLKPEHLGEIIFTVGDPDRVEKVSKYFDTIEYKGQKRELKTHMGTLNGKRITVLSTGMGTGNIDIVWNELDALVNIDLNTRAIKEELTSLTIIRLGTSGALQADVPLDSILVSETGTGLDNLLYYYESDRTELYAGFTNRLSAHLGLVGVTPYSFAADKELVEQFAKHFMVGNTLTCPGFYGPQGRQLRLKAQPSGLPDKLQAFNDGNFRFHNFEMETSGMYGLGYLLGHKCLSINAIIANRASQQFSSKPKETVDRMIREVLAVAVGQQLFKNFPWPILISCAQPCIIQKVAQL